jgi:hypothetical protein
MKRNVSYRPVRETGMSKRVADVLIDTLQAAGVKRCYGIVGDTRLVARADEA